MLQTLNTFRTDTLGPQASALAAALMSVLRERPEAVAAALLAANLVLILVLYGGFGRIVFCCDANHYLETGKAMSGLGLFEERLYLGYRSYLPYTLIEVVTGVGEVFGFESARAYAVGATLLYGVTGGILIATQGAKPGFLPVFAGLLANPFVAAVVPSVLQESLVVLFASPLLLLCVLSGTAARAAATAGLVGALLYMIKSSLMVSAALALVFVVVLAALQRDWRRGGRVLLFALLPAAVLIAPQVVSSLHHFGTPVPYPSTVVLDLHLSQSASMWRYDTVFYESTGGFAGLRYPTPFPPEAGAEIYGDVAGNLGQATLLGAAHILAGFNYQNLLVYVSYETAYVPEYFSPTNFVVGLILFAGVTFMVARWFRKDTRWSGVLPDLVAVGSLAPLVIASVETRFTLLALSVFLYYALLQLGELLGPAARDSRVAAGEGTVMEGVVMEGGVAVGRHAHTGLQTLRFCVGALGFAFLFTTFSGVVAVTPLY